MQKFSVIAELQTLIHPDDLPVVITALKQDRQVWERLQDQSFFDTCTSICGENPLLWKPAVLFLVDLKIWQPDIYPVLDYNLPAAEKIKEEAEEYFQAFIHHERIPACLSDAGLLALALFERRRKNHQWDWLYPMMSSPGSLQQEDWKTPLSCLYGLLPDPSELLHALAVTDQIPSIVPLLHHICVSNQVKAAEQQEFFAELADRLSLAGRSLLFKHLSGLGQSSLATTLAKFSLKNSISLEPKNLPGNLPKKEEIVQQALDLEQLASLYYLAGEHHQSLVTYQKAQESVIRWMDELQGKIFASSSRANPGELTRPVLDALYTRTTPPAVLQNELALGFSQSPEVYHLLENIPAQALSPLARIQQAGWEAGKGNISNGRRIASEAMQSLAQRLGSEKYLAYPLYGHDWNPIHLVKILKDLGLTAEAVHLSLLALQVNPGDVEIASECSVLLTSLGDLDQALEYARLSVALSPHDPGYRRLLATALEQVGDWESAWSERNRVLELDPQVGPVDNVNAGKVALHLKNFGAALDQAQLALRLDAHSGAAYCIMGESHIGQGEIEEAINNFSRATLLAPETEEPWLLLADTYLKQGENHQALEVLRTATLAVPESAEVNFRLGKTCLDLGQTSEALPFLKHASMLNPSSLNVGFELGKTLHELGYSAEASQVFEETRKKWPMDPELAYAQAITLLALGKPDLALNALDATVKANSPRFEWYSLHARTLLGTDCLVTQEPQSISPSRLVNARQSLEKALTIQPKSFPERLLLAEILTTSGKLDEALAIYREISEQPLAGDKEWRWRLQAGLGKTALQLKMAPAAIAALQEAVEAQPENIRLIRLMVEALILANLRQEAVQMAHKALHLAPAEIQNLSWFASKMIQLNEEREALNALQCASQLDPGSPSHFVELAGLQMKLGDLAGARYTLERFKTLPGTTAAQYHQAAYTYLRLEDPSAAADCLEHALEQYQEPPVSLLIETGCIYHRLSRHEIALGMIQKAILSDPERAYLFVFQSDLLSALNRLQAALASLEQARKLFSSENPNQSADFQLMGVLMPQSWLATLMDPAALDERFAILLRRSGDYSAAYQYALNARKLEPTVGLYTYLLAELYLSINETGEARNLLSSLTQVTPQLPAELLCLQAETLLDLGEEIQAGLVAGECVTLAPQCARTLALQSRLMALKGDWKDAGECFRQACEQYQSLPSHTGNSSFGLQVNLLHEKGLWLSEAALSLHKYQPAMELLETYVNENPKESRANLAYGRGLVLCAENVHTMELLKSETHAPGNDKLGDTWQNRFESALLTAGKLHRTGEVNRWLARGRAAYKPIPQHVRPLVNMNPDSTDTAALVAVLRKVNNPNAALQMAQQYPEHLGVQLQLALCLLKTDPVKALDIAHKNCSAHPSNPLVQAAMALIAEIVGLHDQALESLELALDKWPDEPEWHYWAASLVSEQNDHPAAILHLITACNFAPNNVRYKTALAQKYFELQEFDNALQTLEQAVELAPLNFDLWLLLARTHLENGQMDDALSSAHKANNLNPTSSNPLLLCGEIYQRMGNLDEALHYANYAINRTPQDEKAVLFLTRILAEKGKSGEVLKILDEAIRLGLSSRDIQLERAKFFMKQKGPQAALPLFSNLASEIPNDSEILGLLAQTQADTGDLGAAEINAAAALKLDPKIPGLNLFVGKLKRKSGQLDQAIHYLSSNIQQFPLEAESYIELGHTYEERREYNLALKAYQQAIRRLPDDYRPYLEAAMIMKESKDYIGAEAMLRRAAELHPADVNIRRQLAAVITLNLVHNARKPENNK